MELAIYIKELLYNNDTLTIPGFGGFCTNYRASEIREDEHSILPPMKYLVYDKDLTGDSDLLVQYISKNKKITKKNAEKYIKQQVDLLNKKLGEGETIGFEGIGYFSKENDVVRFEREHASNFLTDSYGLSTIPFRSVEVTLEPQQIPVYNSSGKRRGNVSAFLWVAGVIVLAGVVVAGYVYFPGLKAKFLKGRPAPKVTEMPVAVADSSSTAEESDTAGKSNDLVKFFDSRTNQKNALAIDSTKVVKPSLGRSYFIIAGSFKTFKRANILAKQLKKEGFKTEVLQFSEDLFRVSLGEYGDKTEAIGECDKIRASKGSQSVWVLSK